MSQNLHIVAESPWVGSALKRCLSRIGEDDAVVLVGDGVYAATPAAANFWDNKPRLCRYAFLDDLRLRGLESHPAFEPADSDRVVSLAVEYARCLSWLP